MAAVSPVSTVGAFPESRPLEGRRRAEDRPGEPPGVIIHLSPEARRAGEAADGAPATVEESNDGSAAQESGADAGSADKAKSKEAQAEIRQLEQRDREVRAHEAAHAAAAGGLGGAPSFTFQTGPDGRQYAVGGEVSVDTSPGRTPEETIAKAQRIRAAATAPASPSAQDMAVAASATQMEMQARMAQAKAREESRKESGQAPGAGARAVAAYRAQA